MKRLLAVICLLFVTAVSGTHAQTGPLVRIHIYPGCMAMLPESQQQFWVTGVDKDGNEVPVTDAVTWSSDASAGTITPGGQFSSGMTVGRYMEAIKATTSSGLSAVAIVDILEPKVEGGYILERVWGSGDPGQFSNPFGLDIDQDGYVYIADYIRKSVQKFTSSGNYVTQYGMYGIGNSVSAISDPQSVAIFRDYLYIAENYAILKVNRITGNLIKKWGSSGSGNGQINQCRAIAVDSLGNVYVAELGNDRIQKFDSDGNFVRLWGSNGTLDGQFMDPHGVCVDSSGDVYVVDKGNNRIQKFTSDGEFIGKWGEYGTGDGQFNLPYNVAIDNNGDVYVADYNNSRIQVFTNTGTFVRKWGSLGREPGQFLGMRGIAIDPVNNAVYVTADNRIQKFDQQGNYILQWGKPLRETQVSFEKMNVDRLGRRYFSNSKGLQIYDCTGCYLSNLSISTTTADLNLTDFTVDNQGYIYVIADYGIAQKYDPLHNRVGSWLVNGSRIAVDNNGYIYLIDGNTITKYDSSMIRITSWIYTDIGTSQFNGMNHICVDANGLLFTVESNNNRVQKFDINGNSISSWGTLGNANGQFNFPSGISVDDSSFIYVADTLNSRIQKFTLDGKFVSKWGSRGTANWQFQRVKSIDVDAQGCVYALDSGNNRIHKYSPVSSSSTEVKRFQEGKSVLLNGVIVTAGTSEMGDCFYVESEDRSSGIKVTGKSAARGSKVLVQGTVTELDGEAVIEATSVVPLGTGSVEPVGMNNAALGGSSAGLQQALWGIRSGSDAVNNTLSQIAGLNNVGLLVRLWGKVSRIDVNNRNFFVDDGFGDPLKCSVPAGVSLPGTDDFVSVTGISSCRFNTDQHLIPLIRVRDQDDIRILVDK